MASWPGGSATRPRWPVVAGLLDALGWVVLGAGFTGAVALVAYRARHGETTVGGVVLTVLLLQRAQQSTSQLAQAISQILAVARVARRLHWLEDEVSTGEQGRAPTPVRLAQGIVFDHVRFAYPGTGTVVIDDLSMTIPAGTAVAVVGENGAGKTTLAKLLTRMYEPDSGSITVDGPALGDLDVELWRAWTTATFQDFARYELRAGHVVGIGDLARLDDDAAVRTALDRTGATPLVSALDHGMDTLLDRSFADGRAYR